MLRIITADNTGELAVVAHLRGWCHDMSECAICHAQTRAHRAERSLNWLIAGE